jgi:hypothetical protein
MRPGTCTRQSRGRGNAGPSAATIGFVSTWVEIGDRVFVRRYEFYDQNIGVVLGDGAAMVIDTRSTHAQAREILADLRMPDARSGDAGRGYARALRPRVWEPRLQTRDDLGADRLPAVHGSDRRAAARPRRRQ